MNDQPRRPALPDERRESQLFWRLRRRTVWEHFHQLMTHARLRTVLVVTLSLFFWAGLFALFYLAFDFLLHHLTLDPSSLYSSKTIEFVFHLFFASLNVMLIFSAGIIVFGGLFTSEESAFLMTLPVRPERMVLHKFQEALLFSCWGFILLASPMTIAYGIAIGAPWHYYVLAPPLILAFAYIPSALGAIFCLLIVHRYSKMRLFLAGLIAAISLVAAGSAVWHTVRAPQGHVFTPEWFQETLRRFRFTQEEWLPSTWLSRGLLEAARVEPTPVPFQRTPAVASLINLALLVANALMCRLVLTTLAARCFRSAYHEVQCRPQKPRRGEPAAIDRFASWLLTPFPDQMRLLLIKDWRQLRRDPVQWTQFLIFFGLLGLYFLNMNRFQSAESQVNQVTWINMVSFLNLAVVGLILSTFTTRFIYPMISLEGRRFWVLGLMPVSRETIVYSKFCFAALGSWGPCAGLVLLSDLMLHITPGVILMHQYGVFLLSAGLAALAVGLGASMPNFHETSPSKIAAGFGGTLNLVLSALYIILIVVLTAMPMHVYLLVSSEAIDTTFLGSITLQKWVWIGAAGASLVGIAAIVAPLKIGMRSFRALEFY